MKFVLKLMVLLVVLGLIIGGLGGFYVHQEYQQINNAKTQDKTVYVLKKGTSLRTIYADLLAQEPNSYVFRLWLKLHPELTKVRVGTYNIPAQANFSEVLAILTSGKVRSYSISLIEGGRFSDFLKLVQKDSRLEHELKADISLAEIAELLEIERENPEGLLMPDTYSFEDGTTDLEVLKRSHQAQKDFLAKEFAKRDPNLPYADAYEALIMASIIEKESAVAKERPLVASVFINRLRKGMKLQTDPTVIYGVGDRYKGRVLKSFLTDNNPYNTYVIDGLPPTPIAIPSRASIKAALHPAKTDYLFFVALGPDSREGHVFSKTGREHEKAVVDYRRRVADYKKSLQAPQKSKELSDQVLGDQTSQGTAKAQPKEAQVAQPHTKNQVSSKVEAPKKDQDEKNVEAKAESKAESKTESKLAK